MFLISYKSLKYKFKKDFININKKLYFFLFYLFLNIKDLLLLSFKDLILLKLYIFNDYSLKEFSLYFLY
jgi:hypothetical protein